jgi:hypothetical protein
MIRAESRNAEGIKKKPLSKQDITITRDSQISIFTENEPGVLAGIYESLGAEFKIKAFILAETGSYGIFRMVVNNPKGAYDALLEKGFAVSDARVLNVKTGGYPDAMYNIASILGDKKVNIHYAYQSRSGLIVLRVSDIDVAEKELKKNINLIKRKR